MGTFNERNKQMFEKKPIITDDAIISALLGTIAQREAVFKYLYGNSSGYKSWVINHICTNQGDLANAEDVFQECLILLDRNIRENIFERNGSIKTYFFGIVKQYWFNQKRKMNKVINQEIPETQDFSYDIEGSLYYEEKKDLINEILTQIGGKCRQILSLYKLSLSNTEIAAELGLSSPEMAKKYTYRCREKFKAFVLKRSHLINLLSIKNSKNE